MAERRQKKNTSQHRLNLEIALIAMAVVSGVSIVVLMLSQPNSQLLQVLSGLVFTASLVLFIRIKLDPDSVEARQSDSLLTLSNKTLDAMHEGLNAQSAQQICDLLLPETQAIAVAITDRENILGYSGYDAQFSRPGTPIASAATSETIADGQTRVLRRREDIGLANPESKINAAIVQPLMVGRKIEGTLKFYYRKSSQINETQRSIARGFAQLLSTQMAASALEEQTQLATSMELKALQAQINPHFLFNTINTIASFIRTDPNKARELLREFAVFYRSTLENANDLISLEREIKQVERYFMFEVARFGDEMLALEVMVEPELMDMLVPSFLIQPLVENSVRHGRLPGQKLTIQIIGTIEGDNAVIRVADNGVGMSEERRQTMMNPESSRGLGIAVKNVHDRMRSYFGPDARMEIQSELGVGTMVSFVLGRDAVGTYLTADDLQQVIV